MLVLLVKLCELDKDTNKSESVIEFNFLCKQHELFLYLFKNVFYAMSVGINHLQLGYLHVDQTKHLDNKRFYQIFH